MFVTWPVASVQAAQAHTASACVTAIGGAVRPKPGGHSPEGDPRATEKEEGTREYFGCCSEFKKTLNVHWVECGLDIH